MRKIIAAFVSPVLVVVALVVGASTAHAQPTGSIDIVLGDEGQLIGKGAVATLPLEVTCTFSGDFVFSEGMASLRQAQGGHRLVTASAGVVLQSSDCDGTPHFVDLAFFPAEAPLKPGVAVVGLTAVVCFADPATGESACVSDSEALIEVRLKN
ncbi:MAG: hypothetical protein ACRD0W_07785 [Acidimicrobiales bacterium]